MGSSSPLSGVEPSDAALLAAVGKQRDQAAFQELFHRYAPRLKAHFLRGSRNEALAEDLAQDVLLSVWHHAEAYRPELGAPSTWIFRIARNRFIDVVRRQRYVELEQPVLDAQPSGDEAADDELDVHQLSEHVSAALRELSPEQVEVIQGSYFAHESASQIAARLGIPTGTVKSRLRAGMQQLKARLFAGARRSTP